MSGHERREQRLPTLSNVREIGGRNTKRPLDFGMKL